MKYLEVFVLCVMCMCVWFLGYAFVSFWICRVVVHLGVHLVALCWSMLLCEVLGLPCVVFFLCIHVLVPGDVISSGLVVSDWSS